MSISGSASDKREPYLLPSQWMYENTTQLLLMADKCDTFESHSPEISTIEAEVREHGGKGFYWDPYLV